MAKKSKQKHVNYSEIFRSINSEITYFLNKTKNGSDLKSLTEDEREQFWNALLYLFQENNLTNVTEENINKFKKGTELVLNILSSSNFDIDVNYKLLDILKYLNSDVNFEANNLFSFVSKINEYWMVKMQNPKEIPRMQYYTLRHLMTVCCSEKPLVSDLKRLGALHKAITVEPFDQIVPSLISFLCKLVRCTFVIGSNHGQRFIAHSLILSKKIMTEVHKTVMLDLRSCNKKKSESYAKMYVIAWHNACEDMKDMLLKTCFRKIMGIFFKERRTSLELSKIGQNVLMMLQTWHSERKNNNPDFIAMITDAYQPLLWKYLQSGFTVHRSNATDVLFKAFPLERSDDDATEAEKFFKLQFKNMLKCLTDECHLVRIIGLREICNIVSHYWDSFNSKQIKNLMSIIIKCASDSSSADIRKMVYIGFKYLVNSPLSSDYVKNLLIKLPHGLHDANQKVRIAFIQLLICIKHKKDPNFKYIDVVSMSQLQYRLGIENIVVGHWIVKLLIRNYYNPKMPAREWFKRFVYLIKLYGTSYRNFFFYSNKIISFSEAYTIMYEILCRLGTYVISKLRSSYDQENNKSRQTKKKKRNEKSIEVSDLNDCPLDNPEVVFGLFDIVTILWIIHDGQIQKPENEEIRFKLYDTYIKFAQPCISYYKNCDLLYGIIGLSSNIPASLLRIHSITLPGYCVKALKSIKIETTVEENDKMTAMIIALVKWGRGGEILEQVTLWLEAAFETQNMNETILPRRVKINETIQPNSIVAIYILDALLNKDYLKINVLKKNYQELYNLWKFMSKIRELIKTRLEQGEPFEEDLVSDQFIKLCFRRYIKLILILKENKINEEEKENFSTEQALMNYQNEIEGLITWGENFLYLFLQKEELNEIDVDLVITLIKDILHVTDNMIIIHSVDKAFYLKVFNFTMKLLNTKYGLHFVTVGTQVASTLSHSFNMLFDKDNLHVFTTIIPSLLFNILNVLSSESTQVEVEDLLEIKTNFEKVLMTLENNLKLKSNVVDIALQLKSVVGYFLDSIVKILCREISRADFSIPMYSSVSGLPPVANCLLILFFTKKTRPSLFLHVISTKLATYNTKSILACLHLIYLFAKTGKNFNEDYIKISLNLVNNKFKETINKNNDVVNLTMDTTEDTGASNAATKGNTSTETRLLSRPTEFKERVIKKMAVPNIDKNSSTSETTSCVQNEGNLDKNLMNSGLELVKIVENILKKKK